jgi:hypothetical protein
VVARELVVSILNKEDTPTQARFDPEERVAFTSARQYQLFELLDALRRLDPALAGSLIETQPELAAAAVFFPFGMRSVHEAWAKRFSPPSASAKAGYGMGGSGRDMAFVPTMAECQASGQFGAAFHEAREIFHQDVRSNGSVRECWPSTQAFRSLLYAVGKSMGSSASVYLEQIPDPELRLYAQIEFSAALAGLPAYSGMRASAPLRANV